MDERNRCIRCGRYEEESAGENCHNPVWHLPDRNRTDVRPVGNLGGLLRGRKSVSGNASEGSP